MSSPTMDIDEPGNRHTGLSTLQIPPDLWKHICVRCQRTIRPEDDDAYIRRTFCWLWFFVNETLKQDPQRRNRLADFDSFLANVERTGEAKFFQLLRNSAEQRSWEGLFESDVFLKGIENVVISEQEWYLSHTSITAERAWKTNKFNGDAADVLVTTISNYLNKEREVYARHTSIVNSSGTGKSRMVDQMAMKIITVPMCLREDGSKGFPPPDHGLRDWLFSIDTNPFFVAKKLQAFIYSLLTILHKHLKKIEEGIQLPTEEGKGAVIERQRNLADVFHTNMSEGQTFKSSNAYRQSFYKEVINEAHKFIQSSEEHTPNPKGRHQFPPDKKAVQEAGEDLCTFIDPHRLLDSNRGPRRPLIVLSFDEAHTLTDIPKDRGWTVFSELRRTLRVLVNLPIFSLFLSTAGSFRPLLPEIQSAPSGRIMNLDLDPITEISFDDIALPVEEYKVTLDQVVQMDWMSHLGRPLFGCYYDSLENKNELLHFAKHKLLNGPSTLNAANRPGTLACLSVRFALEFNADGISRRVACTQVERHMRLCIAATTGFEQLVTLAGSEPLLAEAAYKLMRPSANQDQAVNPVKYLADHSDLNCLDRGRRGGLVAALIIMQARDAAISEARWVSVSQFMEALLPVPAYQKLSNSKPRFSRKGDNQLAFSKTFEHHSMWFNHVIKIEDSDVINVEFLWRFITRGAMIMCTHGQYGVDLVLPVCDMRKPLSRDNVTAVLIQVNKRFGLNISEGLFDGMDPFALGLFSEGQSPTKPVIRVIFALGSDNDGIMFPPTCDHPDDFTTFDIWCAGLSSNTFKQIGDQDLDPYRRLLERSFLPHDAFDFKETDDRYLDDNTKVARGRRRRRMATLTMSESKFTS